jgi:hypothetical protein
VASLEARVSLLEATVGEIAPVVVSLDRERDIAAAVAKRVARQERHRWTLTERLVGLAVAVTSIGGFVLALATYLK